MASKKNTAWQLEKFIDSLTYELDKARETLSVKSVNNPLTYAVKDIALDLQVFPEYDGENVRFVTAGTNEEGSSKMSLTLGSITDRQIRETSKKPLEADDVTLDEVKEIQEPVKKKLERLGVRSVKDIEKFKKKNIKVSDDTSGGQINFKKLAGMISKSKMAAEPPRVVAAQLTKGVNNPIVTIDGDNLIFDEDLAPSASFNNTEARVLEFGRNRLVIELTNPREIRERNQLQVNLDEDASFVLPIKVKLKR